MDKLGKQIRKRKTVLESDITELVKAFEDETGVAVKRIQPHRMNFKRGEFNPLAIVEIKLEI